MESVCSWDGEATSIGAYSSATAKVLLFFLMASIMTWFETLIVDMVRRELYSGLGGNRTNAVVVTTNATVTSTGGDGIEAGTVFVRKVG